MLRRFAFAFRVVTHKSLHANSRHTPRKRSIQYAAAFRFHHRRLGILDRPPSRAMTTDRFVAEPSLRAQAKQSIAPRNRKLDCFVAPLLAMTADPNMTSRPRGAMHPSR